jgi:hypothetical protein
MSAPEEIREDHDERPLETTLPGKSGEVVEVQGSGEVIRL